MKNLWVLCVGLLLIGVGVVRPDISWFKKSDVVVDLNKDLIIPAPSSETLRSKAEDVKKSLLESNDRKKDGKRLAQLYNDLAVLIELDNDEEVIKNTEEIRQANRLSGIMLKLDIKGKYPNLSKASNSLLVDSIGDDSVLLNKELRVRAVEAFRALAWACNEGSK